MSRTKPTRVESLELGHHCRFCGALPGEWCRRNPRRYSPRLHGARWTQWRRDKVAAWDDVTRASDDFARARKSVTRAQRAADRASAEVNRTWSRFRDLDVDPGP